MIIITHAIVSCSFTYLLCYIWIISFYIYLTRRDLTFIFQNKVELLQGYVRILLYNLLSLAKRLRKVGYKYCFFRKYNFLAARRAVPLPKELQNRFAGNFEGNCFHRGNYNMSYKKTTNVFKVSRQQDGDNCLYGEECE